MTPTQRLFARRARIHLDAAAHADLVDLDARIAGTRTQLIRQALQVVDVLAAETGRGNRIEMVWPYGRSHDLMVEIQVPRTTDAETGPISFTTRFPRRLTRHLRASARSLGVPTLSQQIALGLRALQLLDDARHQGARTIRRTPQGHRGPLPIITEPPGDMPETGPSRVIELTSAGEKRV